jgi:single-strand DNA-binding protein
MFSFNRVHIIGYQTQPVQIRQTPGGSSVTDLNLVVPYSFKTEGGDMLEAKGFHTVTLWGPMAEVAGKYLKAGSQVLISGRLQTDSWEDPKTNEKRSKTKIIGMDMIMLDPKEGLRNAPAGGEKLITGVNRADICGNVTKDPEMRTTTGGTKVLTLGVATNERWKDKSTGEDKERSEFHNVVLWGETAERVAQSVRKGNRVFVSGRVQTRSWETKEGSKRYTTEIVADSLSLLGMRNPIIESSISMDGAPRSASNNDFDQSESAMASSSPAEIPAIQYASEIKAEDLPF